MDYTTCTDFAELMSGTNSRVHPAYMEAAKSIENVDNKALGQMRDLLTSMEKVSANSKTKETSIIESKGNIKNFKGYKDIQTVLTFLEKILSGDKLVKDLKTIASCLENCQSQYSEGCRNGIYLISAEYENSVYLLVTGLSWTMATQVDVALNNDKVLTSKKSTDHGLIPKLCHELATQLGNRNHRDYLDGLIKGNSEFGSLNMQESVDMVFTEGLDAVAKTVTLIDNIVNGIKRIGTAGVSLFRSVKNSVFGIVPLIRSVIYLRYKKKADTVLALEQQAKFIEMNIEQLQNIKTMDAEKKAVIIKKQQAVIEAYRKKAEKLRAELSDSEREASTAINKDPKGTADKTSSDDDFVLESLGYHGDKSINEGIFDIFKKKKDTEPTTGSKGWKTAVKTIQYIPLTDQMVSAVRQKLKKLTDDVEHAVPVLQAGKYAAYAMGPVIGDEYYEYDDNIDLSGVFDIMKYNPDGSSEKIQGVEVINGEPYSEVEFKATGFDQGDFQMTLKDDHPEELTRLAQKYDLNSRRNWTAIHWTELICGYDKTLEQLTNEMEATITDKFRMIESFGFVGDNDSGPQYSGKVNMRWLLDGIVDLSNIQTMETERLERDD